MIGFSGTYGCQFSHKEKGWLWDRVMFSFWTPRWDEEQALTWVDSEGDAWRTADSKFLFDKGSIPPVLRALPGLSHDGFERSYAFHDNAIANGGLLRRLTELGPWEFVELARAEMDRMLRSMVRSEGGGPIASKVIYAGVRVHAAWVAVKGWFA